MDKRVKKIFFNGFESSYVFRYSDANEWAAIEMGREIKSRFKSLSWFDCGKLVGLCFRHKPNDGFLEDLTGVKKDR